MSRAMWGGLPEVCDVYGNAFGHRRKGAQLGLGDMFFLHGIQACHRAPWPSGHESGHTYFFKYPDLDQRKFHTLPQNRFLLERSTKTSGGRHFPRRFAMFICQAFGSVWDDRHRLLLMERLRTRFSTAAWQQTVCEGRVVCSWKSLGTKENSQTKTTRFEHVLLADAFPRLNSSWFWS